MKKLIFILAIISLILFTACDPDPEVIAKYNEQLNHVNELRVEHDYLINDLNINVSTKDATNEKIEKYLAWVDENEKAFYDFIDLIKKNKWDIKTAGGKPDEVILDTSQVVETINANKEKFEKFLQENLN